MNESVMMTALALEAAGDLNAIAAIAERALNRLEFEKFAVSYISQDRYEAAELVPLSNISADFLKEYAERDYFLLDPLSRYCLKTTTPFVWEEVLALREQPPIVRRIYSEAAEFGLPHGMTIPVWAPEGLRGSITFAGERSSFGPKERLELHVLGIVLHNRIGELCAEVLAGTRTIHLTEREQETLKWGALGKTSDDIAGILGVTKRTIDQHFENAAKKLGTVNRVQTVVKAFRERLISI